MPDDWVMLPRKEEEEEDDWELLDNDYDETLREERTPFYSDLKDPEMERLLIASTMAEVGDQGPEAQKAYIESVMNRSRARNMPLAETITDPNYYPGTTLSRLGRTHEGPRVQQLRRTIMEVVSGSNLSGYATGNESGDVHSGGAPVSYDPETGERFVQENPDKEWVEQISTRGKKAKEPDDWEIVPASASKEKQEPDDWEIIPPGGKLDKPADEFKPAFQAKQSPEGLIDTVETGINAGKEFFASIPRGLMGAGIGLGETINRYAYSPIIHGLREAIDYVAPDTGLSRFAKYVDDEFYKNTVEIPAQQREQLGKESAKAGTAGEIGHAIGTMAGDLPTIMLTSGLLPELKTGMELVNSLRHGAAAMTVPAMRAGTDAAAEVKKNGGGEAEQFGAWVKATTIMMGIGAVPMSTKSGAASMAGRVLERGAKTVPLASASVEAARLGDNLLSSITGGEQHSFSLEENIKATIPMAILGGVAGRDTRPSRFERTYGFSERAFDKAQWMRTRMEAEGIAKATPEKVMEWEAQWKKQEGEWPEEAPVAPEAKAEAPAAMPGGEIVLEPKAAKPTKEPASVIGPEPTPAEWIVQHASPHDFERFSMASVGTGEGHQAFGRGLYFSEGVGTHKSYMAQFGGEGKAVSYKVKINANKDHFIDWDKPLVEQGDFVKDKLKAAGILDADGTLSFMVVTPNEKVRSAQMPVSEFMRVQMPYADMTAIKRALGQSLRAPDYPINSPQGAAEFLNSIGIKGIRYLDATSRGKAEGTRNIVIFDENVVKILEKNGQPVKPGPVSVKPSRQALGIVASPKATKGFEQAKEEAKNIADFLNKAEHWGPWNSALGNLVAGRQKATDQVKKQAEALKKLAPDAEARKGITMWIEADGNVKKLAGWGANTTHAEGREAYRQAGALKPNEIAVAEKIKQRYQALRMEAIARGIDIAEMDNYITHLLARSEVPGTGRKGLSSFFRFAKPRTYDTFFQALKAGEKPKTLDAVDILSVYEITLQNAIKNKMFVDRLKYGEARDGRPILAKSSVKQTPEGEGYEYLHAPGLEHVVVHPDHYKDLSRILGQSEITKWLEERSRNPFVNIGKGVLRMGLEGQKYAKGTMFSLSLFHQLTEGTHAVGHRINPFKLKTQDTDMSRPENYDAAKHGLMLHPDKVSQNMFMEGVGSDNYNLVTKVTRKFGGEAGRRVADLIDGYSHYLFESYIPRLKMDTYNHILERNMGRFAKDLKSGKVSASEVKSLSADQANAAYGHLNYTKMARSPTVQHLMQIALLAPDFFEARARFAAQAGKGAVGLLTGSKTGTEQLIALSLLGIGQYVAARALNQLDHGDAEWDPEHAFQVKTDLGGILPDDRWVGLRSVPEDLHKAVTDAGQFFQNRLSPFARLAAENVFKTNWRHEKTNFAQTIRDMLGNIVPLPLQGFTESISRPGKAHSLSTLEMIYKSTGIQIHRVSPINDAFQFADDWLKKNNPEEYARKEASAFPESRYRPLRFAIEDGDEEGARAEAKKLLAQGDIGKKFAQSMLRPFTGSYANDQRLYDSLDKYDKKVFDAALKRRTLVLDRYRAWVGPLPRIETEDTLHEKMRKAKVKDIKERLAQGLVEEET